MINLTVAGVAGARALGRALVITTAVLALLGCMTPYQARGLTGGYAEEKVDESTYKVSFFGNGNTPKDRVFRFWLYRCADLTAKNGYDYFTILGKEYGARGKTGPNQAGMEDGHSPVDDIVPVRGSAARAPSYIYVPGGTITTWSANGYIALVKGEPDPEDPRSFRAKRVIEDLGPEIRGADYVSPTITRRYSPDGILSGVPATPPQSGGGSRVGVDMGDLKDLLPEGGSAQ